MTHIHDFLCQHRDPSIAANVPVIGTWRGLAEEIGSEEAECLIIGAQEAEDRWPALLKGKRIGTMVRSGYICFEPIVGVSTEKV